MLNIELPYDLAIPLLGIYPRDLKADVHMKTGTRTFIAALFIIARKEKQMPVNGWMDKQNVLYPHNEILFSPKKE